MNIYVSNLSFNVQDEDLREFFAPFGDVSSAKIITDKFTGKSRGFGFVEMPDEAAGTKAIEALDNGTVEGRTIRVTVARPKEAGSKPSYSNSKSPFKDNARGGGGNRW